MRCARAASAGRSRTVRVGDWHRWRVSGCRSRRLCREFPRDGFRFDHGRRSDSSPRPAGARNSGSRSADRALSPVRSVCGSAADLPDIAQRVGVDPDTITNVARAYAERGGDIAATIQRRKRLTPPVEPKITGEVEARLIALACSTPPAGHARWSLRLLERHVALVEDIPDMDHSTIGRVLKKRRFVLI